MELFPLQIGDVVAVTVSGLKLMVLTTSLKHAEGRALPEGQNLANAAMMVPSGGPNDVGTLIVCGPSQIAQPAARSVPAEFSGPEICVDVRQIEDHIPQKK